MAREAIHVKGLAEMNRAFKRVDKDLSKTAQKHLKKAAEPIRFDAASRAERIGNVQGAWAEMRTGVTSRVIYVAPRERGHRSDLRRPNLATLLMDRAMQPALDANADEVAEEVGKALDELAKEWERRG